MQAQEEQTTQTVETPLEKSSKAVVDFYFGLAQINMESLILEMTHASFVTLHILEKNGTMIVSDIQKAINTLPAQMSRIVRGLESQKTPLVSCHINPADKRKIDVKITQEGTAFLARIKKRMVEAVMESENIDILTIRDLIQEDLEQ